jgi:hypothetical protein
MELLIENEKDPENKEVSKLQDNEIILSSDLPGIKIKDFNRYDINKSLLKNLNQVKTLTNKKTQFNSITSLEQPAFNFDNQEINIIKPQENKNKPEQNLNREISIQELGLTKDIDPDKIINSYLKLNVYISNLNVQEKQKIQDTPKEETETYKLEESDEEASLENILKEIDKVKIFKSDIYFLNGEKVKPVTRNHVKLQSSNTGYDLQKLKISAKKPEKHYITKKIEEDYYKEDLDYIYNTKKIYK